MALVGFVISQFTDAAPNAVTSKGAVSPITRETAKSDPVNNPLNAEGNKIRSTTLVYDPPKANPASFKEVGNIFKLSSVDRIIMGNIIIANATLPANAEYPDIGTTIQI